MDKILLDAGSSGEYGGHSAENALRCLRLYAIKSVEGRDLSDRNALVRGAIGHVGLAHHYARRWAAENDEDVEAFYTPIEAMKLVAAQNGELGKHHLATNIALYQFYATSYRQEKLRVRHVEEILSMEIPKRDGSGFWPYTQRLDLAVEEGRKIYIWDHKIVGRISNSTVARYTLSIQMVGYQHLGKKYFGKDFGGVKLNLLGMDRMQFLRELVDPAPEAYRTFYGTICEARERIEKYAKVPTRDWPKTMSEQTCMTPYGPCDAFRMCQWG